MELQNNNMPPWLQDGLQFWSVTFIQASAEDVFNYLTQGEHTQKYFMNMSISHTGEVGGPVSFSTPKNTGITGKLLAHVPNQHFAYSFNFTHDEHDPETIVDQRLSSISPNLTSLRTRHYGFPDKNQTFNDINHGWPMILSQLKTLLETGKPLELPQIEEH